MTWDSSRSWPVRGKLARHLGRLQQQLDAVGEQMREAVATAVGRTVAEAVGEAVLDALAPYAGPAGTESRYYPSWRRAGEPSPWRDPYAYDTYAEPRYDDDDADSEYRSSRGDGPHARRGRHALAAGFQAAAWWLRRHPGQVSLVGALAVGSVAGLAMLTGHVSGIATLALSALDLAYLLDLVRLSRALLDGDATT